MHLANLDDRYPVSRKRCFANSISAFNKAILLVSLEFPIMEPIAKGHVSTSRFLVPAVPQPGQSRALRWRFEAVPRTAHNGVKNG